jgi:hypothetical protein
MILKIYYSRVSPLASDEKLNLKENKSTEVENENLKNLKV